MIVKVQRPLSPPDGPWLVYDESREWMLYLPPDDVPPEVKRTMETQVKAYFEAATTHKNGMHSREIAFGKKMPTQDW